MRWNPAGIAKIRDACEGFGWRAWCVLGARPIPSLMHAGSRVGVSMLGARERGSARGIPARAEGDSARVELVLGLGALWVLGLDLGAALGCTRAGILGLGNARAREGESATPGPRLGAQGREWPTPASMSRGFQGGGDFLSARFCVFEVQF
jgi:hypothetical protein